MTVTQILWLIFPLNFVSFYVAGALWWYMAGRHIEQAEPKWTEAFNNAWYTLLGAAMALHLLKVEL